MNTNNDSPGGGQTGVRPGFQGQEADGVGGEDLVDESLVGGTDEPANGDGEKKRRQQMLLLGGAAVGIVLAAAGLIAWSIQTRKPEKNDVTPTAGVVISQAPQTDEGQGGMIDVQPPSLTLSRVGFDRYAGVLVISAVNQSATITSIQPNGIAGLSFQSSCSINGTAPIEAGRRCQITASLDSRPGNGLTSPQPSIRILARTLNANGSEVAIEQEIPIIAASGVILPRADGTEIQPDGTVPATEVGDPFANVAVPEPQQVQQSPPPQLEPMQPVKSPVEILRERRRTPVISNGGAIVKQDPVTQARQAAERNRMMSTPDDWAAMGIDGSRSSMPVDRTRIITMDRVITAVIERPLSSAAPTPVIAQVDRNVYGYDGRTILLPRGTRIIGDPAVAGERVVVAWRQIIRPDGARFIVTAVSGDDQGMGGIPGKVDNRLGKRYGGILLGTALQAGVAAALGAQMSSSIGFGGAIVTEQNTGAIVADIVRNNLNRIVEDLSRRAETVVPIITVKAGTRITIVPTTDLILAPAGGVIRTGQQQETGMMGTRQNRVPGLEPDIYTAGGGYGNAAGRSGFGYADPARPGQDPAVAELEAEAQRDLQNIPPPQTTRDPIRNQTTIQRPSSIPPWAVQP